MAMTKAQFITEFIDPARAERDAAALAMQQADAAVDDARLAKQTAQDSFDLAKRKLNILQEVRDLLYPPTP